MADRYWVGGAGTWDTTSTTHWSTASGGASGASVPTAADSVFFDQAGTYQVTCTGALTCNDITVSAGTVTFANGTSPTFTISGSMSLIAGTVWSATGPVTFNATTTGKTITTNGTAITGAFSTGTITFNGAGGGWTLGSAFSTGSNASISILQGTFNTGNYNVTTLGTFTSGGTLTRTLNLGSSTITAGASVSGGTYSFTNTGLTFNAGTSTLVAAGNSNSLTGAGLTFYNVSFTNLGVSTKAVSGANTYNNFSVVASSSAGITPITFDANQTINGTLSTTSTTGIGRVFFSSSIYGIGFNLTCNSAPSLIDADFRDIYVIGTAAPISGTRIGNRGNCTGITFSTPKTVYLKTSTDLGWWGPVWATTPGGIASANNIPLPQDTAVIDNTNTGTILTITGGSFYVPNVDMSARTNAFTLALNAATVYGSWKNGSGVTLTNAVSLTFSGGGTQTITSAGKAFPGPITVDTYGGTVQLADALNIGSANALTVTNGSFNTQGYAVTAASLLSNNSNVRAIYLGSSTLSLSSTTFISFSATNLTFNAGTSQINGTNSGTITFSGGNLTFYNVSFTGTNSTANTVSGANTFNNLTFTAQASAGITSISIGGNQTINGTLTCSGASAVQRLFLQSGTIGTQRTLTVNAWSASPADVDFRDIALTGAVGTLSGTRFGDCGNNSGITFPAPKTVYWNLAGSQNWSATGWATSSGGSPAVNNFPLAQDTTVFDNTGSAGTVFFDTTWNIGTFDASARTSAMTISFLLSQPRLYKDWKFGTGVTCAGGSALNFVGAGTQTVTSNGVAFSNSWNIQKPTGVSVQLADALTCNGAGTNLNVTTGDFNAVSYNVTVVGFANNSTLSTVNMGSGTWTLSGAGSVWAMNSSPILIAGTSTIVLSDTSTTARTFAGGGLYYNKLTIGGTTGTSTLTISGANTFGELASTKTVAHTILFTSTTTYNIGKWSVTGTAGNVVTVGPVTAATIYTINIYGPANTGIDYLSVSYCAVSTTSPGELYVGANSTNTAGNTGPIFFTATPSPRTLYWVGGTGNWSSTTKWSTASGGVSGAAIPTSLDSVVFDSLSNATAYTATIDAGVTIARCASFTMAGPASGNVTFAGTVPIAFHGSVSFAATGITRSYTGAMSLAGNSSYTFTTNGVGLNSAITVNGIGSTWTLGSALNDGVSSGLTFTYGTFSTSASNYALTAAQLTSNNSNVRSILLNGSKFTGSSGSISFGATAPNLTFNAGTSTINHGGSGFAFTGGGQTFYNVSITTTGATAIGFTGSNTFNNLTFPSQAAITVGVVQFNANQTISGPLTLNAGTAAAYRTFLTSSAIGTPVTLTVNALAAGAADIDFRDITIAGAAAPISGTRFGDCKGNSGITFDAAKTVYWRVAGGANWGSTSTGSWSATSGGALDATMFPLAQDTAVFPISPTPYPGSGGTVTLNANYNIGTIDMSLRTSNTMTLATGSTTPQIYGNWINGTGITLTGAGAMTFAGRGSQTITSAGVTFTQTIAVNSPSGSVTLQDAFVSSNTSASSLQMIAGTFDANNYNVTLAGGLNANTSSTRSIAVGSGTWTITGLGGWQCAISTNLTVTGTGTISLTSASGKSFIGGSPGLSYSGITLNQGGAGTLTISGNNTFANITNTYGSTGATTISLGSSTQTVGAFTAAGTAGKLLTITGGYGTIVYSGGGFISGVDYTVPTFVRAYPTTATWYVGSNSINVGSLGFIFAPYVPPSTGINGQFFAFF